jgi:hypothetical protein
MVTTKNGVVMFGGENITLVCLCVLVNFATPENMPFTG